MMKRGRGRPRGSKNMTTMGLKSQAVLVKFDPELLDRIVELARDSDRTLQAMIRVLIRRGLGEQVSE